MNTDGHRFKGLKARKTIAQGKASGGRAQAPSDALGK